MKVGYHLLTVVIYGYMLKFIGGVIVTLLLVVGGLAYMLVGTGPKDLGIKYTTDDSVAARKKIGGEIIPITADMNKKDFTLEGKLPVEFEMDSKEFSAQSANRPWKNYPLKNLQIKFNDDGTIEGSATLIISKALPYAMGLGYSETQIREAMQKYNIPNFEVPFYVKGKGQVINDKVTVAAQTVEIGKVSIPKDIVDQANIEAEKVLEDLIQKQSQSFHAEKVTFENGKIHFKGTIAEKQYVLTE